MFSPRDMLGILTLFDEINGTIETLTYAYAKPLLCVIVSFRFVIPKPTGNFSGEMKK